MKDDDNRFDLYIRGFEPIIAEDGGPWTVVEDWQGVQGFSVRYLVSLAIPSEGVLRIPANTATTAFQDSRFIIDGDLAIDKAGTVGIIGSSVDDSGDYTITKIGTLNVDWTNVLDKPGNLVLYNVDETSNKFGSLYTPNGITYGSIHFDEIPYILVDDFSCHNCDVTGMACIVDLVIARNNEEENAFEDGYTIKLDNVGNGKPCPVVLNNQETMVGILDLPRGTTPGLVAPDNQTITLTGTTIGVKSGSISRSHLDTNLAGKIDKIEVASVEEVKTYFGITE